MTFVAIMNFEQLVEEYQKAILNQIQDSYFAYLPGSKCTRKIDLYQEAIYCTCIAAARLELSIGLIPNKMGHRAMIRVSWSTIDVGDTSGITESMPIVHVDNNRYIVKPVGTYNLAGSDMLHITETPNGVLFVNLNTNELCSKFYAFGLADTWGDVHNRYDGWQEKMPYVTVYPKHNISYVQFAYHSGDVCPRLPLLDPTSCQLFNDIIIEDNEMIEEGLLKKGSQFGMLKLALLMARIEYEIDILNLRVSELGMLQYTSREQTLRLRIGRIKLAIKRMNQENRLRNQS